MDISVVFFLVTLVSLVTGFVSGFLIIGSLKNRESNDLRMELDSQRDLYSRLLEEKTRDC